MKYLGPEITRTIEEKYRQTNHDWSSRIKTLAITLEKAQILGVEDAQINEVAINSFLDELSKNPTAYKEFARKFNAQNYGEKMFTLASIRNSYRGNEDSIRLALQAVDKGLSGQAAVEAIHQKVDQLNIGWIENRHHPLNHLYATIGYEIEHAVPYGFNMLLYEHLNRIGFKKGDGGPNTNAPLEASPGPFYRPETASLIYSLWSQSGLIDFYAEYGQTFHSNVGLRAKDGMPELVMGLMATGFAWMPIFAPGARGEDWYHLKIRSNGTHIGMNDLENIYKESKDFAALTFSGTIKHLHLWSHLGTAAKAYQTYLLKKEDFPDFFAYYRAHKIDNYYSANDILLSPRRLESGEIHWIDGLTVEEKELAVVFAKYMRNLHRGFAMTGYEAMLTTSTPMEEARKFGKAVEAVFPDLWSRYWVDPAKVKSQPFAYGDNYANIVHFARVQAWRANTKVNRILSNGEEVFTKSIRAWADGRWFGGSELAHLNKMYSRFPCNARDLEEYRSILLEALPQYQY